VHEVSEVGTEEIMLVTDDLTIVDPIVVTISCSVVRTVEGIAVLSDGIEDIEEEGSR